MRQCVLVSNPEDEQDEEQQQDDLDADDKELREEVSQHRLQGAHACNAAQRTRLTVLP